jgi:ABC-type glycerol-3-phosphate transport system permease component
MKSGLKQTRSLGGNILVYLVLILFGAFFAWPLIFTINNAFKPLNELFMFPPQLWVQQPVISNFQDLFVMMSRSRIPFSRYIFNTVFLTAAGTFGHIIIASMGAYVVSKYRFPGSQIFFKAVIITLMFSVHVTAIPNFLIMNRLTWVDTYWAIIVPAFAMPIGFFLMKQFMDTVPMTLIEAAKIDGAREFSIFWKIVMPTVKPAWLTVTVFSVQALWNARASNFIFSEELKTLPYALGQIAGGGVQRAGVAAAVALFIMVVPLAVFVSAQSNIIETMASSGIKE